MVFFDLETDGLLEVVTKIHCMCTYDTVTKKSYSFHGKTLTKGLRYLAKQKGIIGHNIIGFDIPVINKLYPTLEIKAKAIDTLLWARMAYPTLKLTDMGRAKAGKLPGKLIGSHSLKAYGYRLGENKGEFGDTTDWKTFTPEMLEYCEQDIVVTRLLYAALEKRTKDGHVNRPSLSLEHKVQKIISGQERRGFCFDLPKAEKLHAMLLRKKEELKEQASEGIPSMKKVSWFTPKRDNKAKGYKAGVPFKKIKEVPFNPGSRTQIYTYFIEKYNWKPQVFTKDKEYKLGRSKTRGNPKIDEKVLKSLKFPEAPILCEYFTVAKRVSQIADGKEGWLKAVKSYPKKVYRLHGRVNILGTVTGRMSHSTPNLAQVPASYSPYGKECRELFIPSPGYVLVGVDASGLELRCLAHYMYKYDKGSYADQVLESDIHTYNLEQTGGLIKTRDMAKKFIYMFLYGAGDSALAADLKLKGGAKAGKKLKEQFLKSLPALSRLKDSLATHVEKHKWIPAIDGRRIPSRSPHSALNALFQGAGGIVMKKALVLADEALKGYDVHFVGNIHDEVQVEARPKDAEEVGKIIVQAIRDAGDAMGFKCPLDGEYNIGKSWKETH